MNRKESKPHFLQDKVELSEIHPLPTEAKLSLKSDLSVEEELKLSKIKVSQLENKIRAQWCVIESNADVLNSKEKKIKKIKLKLGQFQEKHKKVSKAAASKDKISIGPNASSRSTCKDCSNKTTVATKESKNYKLDNILLTDAVRELNKTCEKLHQDISALEKERLVQDSSLQFCKTQEVKHIHEIEKLKLEVEEKSKIISKQDCQVRNQEEQDYQLDTLNARMDGSTKKILEQDCLITELRKEITSQSITIEDNKGQILLKDEEIKNLKFKNEHNPKLKKEIECNKKEIKDLTTFLQKQEEYINSYKKDLITAKNEADSLDKLLASLKYQVLTKEKKIQSLKLTNETFRKDTEDKAQIAKTEMKKLRNDISTFKSQLIDKESCCESLKQKIWEKEKEIDASNVSFSSANAEILHLTNEIIELKELVTITETQLQNKSSEVISQSNEVIQLQVKLNGIQTENDALIMNIHELNTRLEASESEVKDNHFQHKQLIIKNADTSQQLTLKVKENELINKKLIFAKKRFQTQINEQNVLRKTIGSKDQNISEQKKELDNLDLQLKETQIKLKEDLNLMKETSQELIDLKNYNKSNENLMIIQKKELKSVSAQLQESTTKLSQQSSEIDRLSSSLNEVENQNKSFKGEIDNFSRQRKSANDTLSHQKIRFAKLSKTAKELTNKLNKKTQSLVTLEHEMALIKEHENQDIFNIKKELEVKEKILCDLKMENDKLKENLTRSTNKIVQLFKNQATSGTNFDTQSCEVSSLKVNMIKLEEELKSTKLQLLQKDVTSMVDSEEISYLKKKLEANKKLKLKKETNFPTITLE